jgi:CBS domain-containing protein
MKKLRDIMRSGFLFMVPQDAMVTEAVRMMASHNIGIVIAMDGAQPAGVFSERDVVRRVVDRGREPGMTPIRDVMTTDVITADADEDYQAAMRKMDQANIRHLLVVSDGRLLSMISVRDLIRVDMADKSEELQYLREYLYQVPPARVRAEA